MRIIRTSLEAQIVCTYCSSRIGVTPKDLHYHGEYYFYCPVCGVKISVQDQVPSKWTELLDNQVANGLRQIPT